jgi:hypothetical protein
MVYDLDFLPRWTRIEYSTSLSIHIPCSTPGRNQMRFGRTRIASRTQRPIRGEMYPSHGASALLQPAIDP